MRPLLHSIVVALLAATLSGHAARAKDGDLTDTIKKALTAGLPSKKDFDNSKDFATFFTAKAIEYGSNEVGVSLTEEEAHFITVIVGCMIGGRSVGECGKDALIDTILSKAGEDAQKYLGPFAQCVTDGTAIKDCVTDAVIKQIPEQARPLADCITQGRDVADCGKQLVVGALLKKMEEEQVPEPVRKVTSCVVLGTPADVCVKTQLLSAMPDAAKPLAECMAKDGANAAECAKTIALDKIDDPQAKKLAVCLLGGTPPGECARQFGTGQINEDLQKAIQDALDMQKSLEADADDGLRKKLPNSVNNLVIMARGIRDDRWDLIIQGGGTELAKIVMTVILEYYLGAEFGPLISKIVDVDIQNTHNSWIAMIQAAKKGDVAKINQIILEFTMTMMFQAPCALIPDGKFKEATCGKLAEAVAAAGQFVSGAIKDVGEFLEDAADWIGDRFDDIFSKGKTTITCVGFPSPEEFYKRNFLACLKSHMDTYNWEPVQNACVFAVGPCNQNREAVCQSMQSTFSGFRDKIKAAFPQGADVYTNNVIGAYIRTKGEKACEPDFWDGPAELEFAGQCAIGIEKILKIADNNCPTSGNQKFSNAAFSACRLALARVDKKAVRPADMCKRYDEETAFFNAHYRPCVEDAVRVDFTPGGAVNQSGKSVNDCFLGEWPVNGELHLPHVTHFGAIDPLPGFVTGITDGRSSSTANDFLPSSFVTGRCRPSGRFMDAIVGEFGGSRLALTKIALTDGGFGGCNIGPTGGPSLDSSVGTPPKFSPSGAGLQEPANVPRLPKSAVLPGAGSSGSNTVNSGDDTKRKRRLQGGDAAALPSAKLPSGVGSSGISTSRQPDAAPSKTGTRKKKKLDDPAQAKLTPAKLPSGVGSSGISTSRQPDPGSSAMDRLTGDGMGPGRVGPSGGGSSGISTSRPIPQPSGGGSSGISTSRSVPQPSGGGSSGISTSRQPPQPSGGGSSGISLSKPGP